MTLLVTDRDLLDAFRRGEDWAIEKVYLAFVSQVVALLRHGFSFMSGSQVVQFRGYHDEWELETAVQDTFIQAFSPAARSSYDGIKPFGPYLMTIARNQVISRLRSEQREQRRRSSLAAEGPPPGPGSPEEAAMRHEIQDLVAQFRQSLPAELQSFFDARYQQDQNLMEAARALGLSRMKARIRDQKLRKRFLDFLRQRGHLRGGSVPDGLLTLMVRV